MPDQSVSTKLIMTCSFLNILFFLLSYLFYCLSPSRPCSIGYASAIILPCERGSSSEETPEDHQEQSEVCSHPFIRPSLQRKLCCLPIVDISTSFKLLSCKVQHVQRHLGCCSQRPLNSYMSPFIAWHCYCESSTVILPCYILIMCPLLSPSRQLLLILILK